VKQKMRGDCRASEHPARQRGLSTLNVLPSKGSASRVTLWHQCDVMFIGGFVPVAIEQKPTMHCHSKCMALPLLVSLMFTTNHTYKKGMFLGSSP
jgi:hypothetical protein